MQDGLYRYAQAHGWTIFIVEHELERKAIEDLLAFWQPDGIIVEGDRAHYAFSAPYVLLPDIQSAGITQPLIDSRYYVIVPVAQGLTVGESADATVTTLLTTSDSAFSKLAGYSLDT